MALTAVLSLLTLLALKAAAQEIQEDKYFEIGGNLNLDPKYSGAITSITWKHNGNIIAEYIEGPVPLEYLGDFKNRAELDLTTGKLTLKNMRKSDEGEFKVEINNKVFPVKFKAEGITKLDSIEVILRPLICDSNSHNCSLDCGEKFEEGKSSQYFWKQGDTGEWKKGTKKLPISKETEQVETFSCRLENQFNNVTSGPYPNPYHKKPDHSVLISVLVALLILAAGSGTVAWLIIKKPLCVQNLLNRNSGQSTENRKELENLNTNGSPESGVPPHPEP